MLLFWQACHGHHPTDMPACILATDCQHDSARWAIMQQTLPCEGDPAVAERCMQISSCHAHAVLYMPSSCVCLAQPPDKLTLLGLGNSVGAPHAPSRDLCPLAPSHQTLHGNGHSTVQRCFGRSLTMELCANTYLAQRFLRLRTGLVSVQMSCWSVGIPRTRREMQCMIELGVGPKRHPGIGI